MLVAGVVGALPYAELPLLESVPLSGASWLSPSKMARRGSSRPKVESECSELGAAKESNVVAVTGIWLLEYETR